MLKKIHIQNYRVFEDLTLEFTDGLNVIVGNNDAGKSTLLEAVHLALTSRVGDDFYLANCRRICSTKSPQPVISTQRPPARIQRLQR